MERIKKCTFFFSISAMPCYTYEYAGRISDVAHGEMKMTKTSLLHTNLQKG